MKRWLAIGTIATYLSVMFYGVAAHALNYKPNSHPSMYFIVWDMFCGWSAFSNRIHVIAEGESGRYYEVTPSPWGEIKPFGDLERHHYDPFGMHVDDIAFNTLKHTAHEPITRVYLVEEIWAKKFNLPDRLWEARYPEPKEPYSYFHLQQVYNGEGRQLRRNANWFDYQVANSLNDNPRLHAAARREQPAWQMNSGPIALTNGSSSINSATTIETTIVPAPQ